MISPAIWHDLECGGYAADLEVWERVADEGVGPILDLGTGTGRVALHLARRGHEIWGVDIEPSLLGVLESRASAEGLAITIRRADIRTFELDRRFELAIAPMQLLQILGGPSSRRRALERISSHLTSSGRLAAAITERPVIEAEHVRGEVIPEMRELDGVDKGEFDGWVYSSVAAARGTTTGDLEIHRLRQTVSPGGELSEEEHVDRLEALDAALLETEARAAGMSPVKRLEIPSAGGYLGSTLVVLGAS